MKPQRLRTKMRKIREHGEEMMEEGGELNLIPYLDIVTNVIMFMLATTSFAAALGDINVSSPTTGGPGASMAQEQEPKQELNLTVSVSDKGFIIGASGAILHEGFTIDETGKLTDNGTAFPTIPKTADGKFDYELLNKKMREIKKVPFAQEETKVILNANANILYEVVIATMDACRGKLVPKNIDGKFVEAFELFGDVIFSAGVN